MKKNAPSAALRRTDSGKAYHIVFTQKSEHRANGAVTIVIVLIVVVHIERTTRIGVEVPRVVVVILRRRPNALIITASFILTEKAFFCRQSFFMKKPHSLPPLGGQIPAKHIILFSHKKASTGRTELLLLLFLLLLFILNEPLVLALKFHALLLEYSDDDQTFS